MAIVVFTGFGFESNAFPGVFLRMDGSNVPPQPTGPGSGVVNCQRGAGPWERFQFRQQLDGTTAIESVAFQGVFLRMDGRNVTKPTGPGAGVVNAQRNVGPWEKFRIRINQANFRFSVESVAFPGVFLRMDGTNVPGAATGPGSGVVNCQFGGTGPWEQFNLRTP